MTASLRKLVFFTALAGADGGIGLVDWAKPWWVTVWCFGAAALCAFTAWTNYRWLTGREDRIRLIVDQMNETLRS